MRTRSGMRHWAWALPLVLLAAGCGGDGGGSGDRIELGTMQGTTHFERAAAWSAIMNEGDSGISITTSATTGTQEMLRRVATGELDVGVVTSVDIPQLREGENPVDTSGVRALWGHDQGLWHIVVWADSSYRTVQDLDGAAISVGPPGSVIAGVNGTLWSDIVGIDYEEVSVALPDAAQQMKDGQVDVFTVGAVPPQPTVADLAASRPIRLIPLTPEVQEQFVAQIEGWRAAVLPAESAYPQQANPEDILTTGLSSMYVVNESMDEETAYQLTSAIFDNLEQFRNASAVNRNITLENTLDHVSVPLHPGARRYFEEQGVDLSEVPTAP